MLKYMFLFILANGIFGIIMHFYKYKLMKNKMKLFWSIIEEEENDNNRDKILELKKDFYNEMERCDKSWFYLVTKHENEMYRMIKEFEKIIIRK